MDFNIELITFRAHLGVAFECIMDLENPLCVTL